jgi:hypothetical protein
MTAAEIIQLQITDIFRVGLIVALVVTMLRTRAATGVWLPLVAGLAFVAVIIPATTGGIAGVALATQVGLGLIANLLILVPVGAVVWAVMRNRA